MRAFSLLVLCGILGCSGGVPQPAFPDLHPIKGTVRIAGKPASGGVITLVSDSPKQDFLINSEVGTDGSFKLTTVRLTDSTGERKPGVAAGKYAASYIPKLGDQTSGGAGVPMNAAAPISISGPNENLVIDVVASKK